MRSLFCLPALLAALGVAALTAGTASAQTYYRPSYHTPSNLGMRPSGFTPSNIGMSRPVYGMPDPGRLNPPLSGTVDAATPVPNYQLPSLPRVFTPGVQVTPPANPTTQTNTPATPAEAAAAANPALAPAANFAPVEPGAPAAAPANAAPYAPGTNVGAPYAPGTNVGAPYSPPPMPGATFSGNYGYGGFAPGAVRTGLAPVRAYVPAYTGPQYQSSFYEPLRRVYGFAGE